MGKKEEDLYKLQIELAKDEHRKTQQLQDANKKVNNAIEKSMDDDTYIDRTSKRNNN